jgi:hypothetical protein
MGELYLRGMSLGTHIIKFLLGSRRSRSSPKPLPRIYIRKEILEQEEEESFAELCCPIVEVFFLFTIHPEIKFPSLIKNLRRIKEQGAKGECINI